MPDTTEKRIFVPDLLPVPNLSQPNDSLCDICKSLDLTPRRFVVLPEDNEIRKLDDPDIKLGLVKDIKKKVHCPFCRLVLKAQFKGEVVEVSDGVPVEMLMSWSTDGDPDPNAEGGKVSRVRVLRLFAQNIEGDEIGMDKTNTFPDITLLANDAPTPSKSFFARLMSDQINCKPVRHCFKVTNWLAMCDEGHGEYCNQSFRVIDVVDSCIILAPHNCKYVALSYVWGAIDVAKILRLLKANVDTLHQPGVLLQEEFLNKIPVTIRDAMEVVKRLA